MNKATYTIDEVAQMLNISRTKAYALSKNGSLPVIHIGRCLRVPAVRFEEWLKNQI